MTRKVEFSRETEEKHMKRRIDFASSNQQISDEYRNFYQRKKIKKLIIFSYSYRDLIALCTTTFLALTQ